MPAKPLSNWVILCKCIRHLCIGLLCVNKDGRVNPPSVTVRIKADDACNAVARWLAQSDYSTDDTCVDKDSDDIATLENRSPKPWKLVYR